MPDSNWSVRTAVIGAIALLTFVAFGVGFFTASLPQPENQGGAAESTSQNPSESPPPALQAAGVAAPPTDDVEPSTQDQSYYNREDLQAQRVMAWWTRIMGAAAAIGIVLGGVSIWLIWRTWDATQKAATNSRETLNAYIAKERGYVEATGAEYIDVSPEPFRPGIILGLKNVGLSPLEVFAINYKLVPEGKWSPEGMSTLAKRKLIPAGEDREIGALVLTELTEGWLNGSVEYTTLKNQKFKTYFCFNVGWQDMGGYGVSRWSITQVFPPAMPSNT